jgi:hypothetical protein
MLMNINLEIHMLKKIISFFKVILLGILVATPPFEDSVLAAQEATGGPVTSRVIQVGPKREVKYLSVAAKVAKDGDTVEVDAGDYPRDVAVWTQSELVLRAVGGRVRLMAEGAAAEGKAIWVVRGGNIRVEGFDFEGARVKDRNGAGIRMEKGLLKIVNCRFIDNENGILTGGHAESTLEIINSEFGNNGAGDGQSHNLYVGTIARLTVTGSYFHHAKVGHLLKSRAAINDIRYNRLTDEIGGKASYELEFPNGGVAYVVGNIIQQSSTTDNPHLISYGVENYRWPKNEIHLINNTLIDLRPHGGVFFRVKPGRVTIQAVNNLLIGNGSLEKAGEGRYQNNLNVDFDEFVKANREDFRLASTSRLIGRGVLPDAAGEVDLRPRMEYWHPRSTRRPTAKAFSPGAMQTVGP